MEGAASNLEKKLKDLTISFNDFYSTLRARICWAQILFRYFSLDIFYLD